MGVIRPWTEAEDAIIRAAASVRDALARLPGDRAELQTQSRANKIGVKFPGGGPFAAWEDAIIRAASGWRAAARELPHRTYAEVLARWRGTRGGKGRSESLEVAAATKVLRRCLRCRAECRVERVHFLCEPCRAYATREGDGLPEARVAR